MKKASYAWEDASYLTRKSLRVPPDAWMNIGNLIKIPVFFLFCPMKHHKILRTMGGVLLDILPSSEQSKKIISAHFVSPLMICREPKNLLLMHTLLLLCIIST